MNDLDQLRNVLEQSMEDLAGVLHDPGDWRPPLIYALEVLDHNARTNRQNDNFNRLLAQLRDDINTRLESGSWRSV